AKDQQQKRVFSFFKDVFNSGAKTEEHSLPFVNAVDAAHTPRLLDLVSNDSTTDESDDEVGSDSLRIIRKLTILESPVVESQLASEAQNGTRQGGRGSLDVVDQSWDPKCLVLDLLDYFAEEGNVQMNVFIVMTLSREIAFPEELVILYTRSYLELLYRLQLWNEATKLINASTVEAISVLNGESTSIHRSCSHCSTAVSMVSKTSHCEHCKRPISLCSFWQVGLS
ncbi:WD repeat-containing protein 24, partial [Kappamyces sp. JEL0680]